MKRLLCLLSVLFVFLPAAAVRGAEERITLTTYYPAPFGIYQELAARRLKVGGRYMQADTEVEDGTLIVEERVGIGTRSPEAALDVQGKAIAREAEIHGDALVWGALGVGTTEPEASLDVAGSALIGGTLQLKQYIKFMAKPERRGKGKKKKRPKCTGKLDGVLLFNRDEEAFEYCVNDTWMQIKAKVIEKRKRKEGGFGKSSSPYTLSPDGSPWDSEPDPYTLNPDGSPWDK